VLLDSNIIIYAAQADQGALREFIARHEPSVSAISMVETLGYHLLGDAEREFLVEFFAAAEVLHIDEAVINEAIGLRQQHRISLGDALIAATARVHGLMLVTRNSTDFQWIEGLQLLDPLAAQP
jgi:predicted nucleic acid-binding protein